MSNTKNIKYNFLFSILSQIITVCLGLLIPRLLMVEYGSEYNGLLSSVSQVIAYLALFESGIYAVALKNLYAPVKNGARDQINGIISAVNVNYKKIGIYYLIGLILIAAIYPAVAKVEGLGYFSVSLIILFSGLGNVILFFAQGKYTILLKAYGKNYIITNIQTVITTLVNISKIILLSFGVNIVVVIFATFLISILQTVYICYHIRRHYKWIDLTAAPDTQALEQKGAMLIHQIAALIFQNTDILIITVFCGLKFASVYTVYKVVISHLSSILQIIFNSFSFYLGQLYNTCKNEFIKAIDAVELLCSAIVFPVYSVTLCLFIPFIKLYTAGVTDINYVDYRLAILFVAVELLTFMRIPMLNTINYAGRFRSTLPQTIAESIINIVVSLVAVQYFGIVGVLLGTVVALLYRTTDVIIYSNRKLLDRSPLKTFTIYFVNLILTVILPVAFYLTGIQVDSWFMFIACGAVLTVTAFALHIVTLILAFRDECNTIKNIIITKFKKEKLT